MLGHSIVSQQLVGTLRVNTEFTRALHLFLSWARPIQSTSLHSTSPRSILILSTHLRIGLPGGFFPYGLPTNNLYAYLFSPIRATWPAHFNLLDLIILIILGEEYKSLSSSLRNFLHSPVTSSIVVQISSSAPCSQTPSIYVPPLMPQTKFQTHTEQSYRLVYSIFKLFDSRREDRRFWTVW
jgi:hypothetical protein